MESDWVVGMSMATPVDKHHTAGMFFSAFMHSAPTVARIPFFFNSEARRLTQTDVWMLKLEGGGGKSGELTCFNERLLRP